MPDDISEEPMRRSILAFLSGLLVAPLIAVPAGFAVAIPAAKAQEPLFLRIRPPWEAPADLGGTGPSDDMVARDARARAQAVWDRADRRARMAIASVCTGCLKPEPAPPTAPERPETAAALVSSEPHSPFAQTGAP